MNDYDPKKQSTFVSYLDIEVDLEYPHKLLELHNDYPLAPEKLAVSGDMLSNYCKRIADK